MQKQKVWAIVAEYGGVQEFYLHPLDYNSCGPSLFYAKKRALSKKHHLEVEWQEARNKSLFMEENFLLPPSQLRVPKKGKPQNDKFVRAIKEHAKSGKPLKIQVVPLTIAFD